MKKVVTNLQIGITDIGNVTDRKYYGILMPAGNFGLKGIIMRDSYCAGSYVGRAFNGITYGNMWDRSNSPTLEDCIKYFLVGPDASDFSVYEFDTWQELFQWAIQ